MPPGSDGMERMTRIRLATMGVFLLVFGAGVAVGIVVERAVLGSDAATASTERRRGERDHDRDRGLVIDRVEMSERQRERVDSIVEYHRERMSELWSEFRPRLRGVARDTREDIKAVLDPEQRAAYDSLLARERRKDRDDDRKDRDGKDEERKERDGTDGNGADGRRGGSR